MTNEQRVVYRQIIALITIAIVKLGFDKHGSFKFSFENLMRVYRDDAIRAENKESVKAISKKVKMSRQHMYRVRRRK